jgi:hypothetical protein
LIVVLGLNRLLQHVAKGLCVSSSLAQKKSPLSPRSPLHAPAGAQQNVVFEWPSPF